MKVLLRSDVEGLGRTGDIVEVTRGYARNFLVPKGLAIQAAEGVTAQAEVMRRKRAMKAAADRSDAEAVAAQIVGVVEVVAVLASQVGLVVDRRQVTGEVVKDIGSHEFTIELHAEVAVPVTVEVQAEA